MKLHYVGEKGKAICEKDGSVSVTFAYRDVPFSDSAGNVKDILVGVCDRCGEVVSVPPQSTPAIKAARDLATVPIEANLPAVYLEALDLACYRIAPVATSGLRKPLLTYYVHRLARDPKSARRLFALKPSKALAEGEKAGVRRRLSLKVSVGLSREIDQLAEIGQVNRTELIKSLVRQIDRDIIAPRKPAHLAELRILAATAVA